MEGVQGSTVRDLAAHDEMSFSPKVYLRDLLFVQDL